MWGREFVCLHGETDQHGVSHESSLPQDKQQQSMALSADQGFKITQTQTQPC